MTDDEVDFVIKVFNDQNLFELEKNILQEVQKRFLAHFQKTNLASNLDVKNSGTNNTRFYTPISVIEPAKSIVFTPHGEPITRLTKTRLAQIFECMTQLHDCGVIHRDITPDHFLIKKKGHLEKVRKTQKNSVRCFKDLFIFNRGFSDRFRFGLLDRRYSKLVPKWTNSICLIQRNYWVRRFGHSQKNAKFRKVNSKTYIFSCYQVTNFFEIYILFIWDSILFKNHQNAS